MSQRHPKIHGISQFLQRYVGKQITSLIPISNIDQLETTLEMVGRMWNAFEGIKAIIARDVMHSYPCFSKEFIIHTDASDVQSGGVIRQDNKPHRDVIIVRSIEKLHSNGKIIIVHCWIPQGVKKYAVRTKNCHLHGSFKFIEC